MTRPYLGNPKYTIEVLQKYGFVFQKRFGQNFLIDTRVLDRIIEASEITKDDFVLEIGPGIGTMTQYLADAAREVTAVEIDDALIPILQDTLKEWDNVSVIHGDILKTDIRKIADEKNQGRPIKVVANLPYYITTPIIMGLFESHVPVDSITVMFRKKLQTECRQSRIQGLWRFITGSTVLCKTGDRGKCSAELFYAETEGWQCSDPADQTSESAGTGKG